MSYFREKLRGIQPCIGIDAAWRRLVFSHCGKTKKGCKKTSFLHPFMVYFDVKLAARRICNHLQLGQLPDSSSGEPQFTQKRGFCSSVGVAGVVVTGVATGAAAGAAAALF